MQARGLFIDIEGADGSGKTEQAKRLFEILKSEDRRVTFFDFPRYYDSRIGKLIGELLKGTHGDFMSMPPYVSALPYALDRIQSKPDIEAALADGGMIVSNRYTPSNLAHQSAKLPKDEQPALVDFIEGLEYGDFGIPQPDMVFYLHMPTDISSELILKKEKRGYLSDESGRDLAERNIAHQDRTRAAYLKLAAEKGWHVIDCVRDGTLRTPEDIHKEVSRIVHERIGA
jgi:dTMP kinase